MPPVEAEVGSAANSYEILAKLAEGGMAEIFLARGASTAGVARHVVLKRVLRDRATDANFIRMFLDEARLAAQLQHPNIAQVYDIGKLGDSYFFTMEYVHGETVRALLQRAAGLRRAVPISCALQIGIGAAAGLHHAHERIGLDGKPLDIVHRDVSPSNLMVGYEGHVKLMDFGVAKAADRLQETRSGTVKGKISYLSPEQCRGAPVDRRSDLFSLGIVVWEMLTTERLFRRASDFEAMTAIVKDEVPPPSSRRSEIPPELDAVVLKMLAKHVDDRFQTADEIVEALEAVAAQTASVLSPASLGRLVKELFGQRPEPWVEIAQEVDTKPVTITSEPIPLDLALDPSDGVQRQLASVADLSKSRSSIVRTPTSSPPAYATPPSGSAVPSAIHDNTYGTPEPQSSERDLLPRQGTATVPDPATGLSTTTPLAGPTEVMPAVAPPTEAGAAVDEPSISRSDAAFDVLTRPRVPSPTTPPAGMAVSRPDLLPLGAIAPAYPVATVASGALGRTDVHSLARFGTQLVRPQRTGIVIASTIVAIAVGVVVYLALTGNRVATPATPTPTPVAEDRPAVVPAPATQPATGATTAAPAEGSSAVPATGSSTEVPATGSSTEPPKLDFRTTFAANDFAGALAMCATADVFAQHQAECTIAACRTHNPRKARTYFGSVPATERAKVASTCQAAKVVLEVRRPAGGRNPTTTTTTTTTTKPSIDCVKQPLDCAR